MQLNVFQYHFQHALLEPDHLNSNAPGNPFRQMLRQDQGICLENRMKVYRNNVIGSLTNAVVHSFSMTEKLVGKAFLQQAVRTFVVNHLPQQGNLHVYGGEFPDFIRNYAPAGHLPYLYDFTRLEWMQETAYYAPDALPLNPAILTTIPQENIPNLRLFFHKSCSLLESDYPLDKIFHFCRTEDEQYLQAYQACSSQICRLMIYRRGLTVELLCLDAAEYHFLTSLQDGKTISTTVKMLTAMYPEANSTSLLQKHLQQGSFIGFNCIDLDD